MYTEERYEGYRTWEPMDKEQAKELLETAKQLLILDLVEDYDDLDSCPGGVCPVTFLPDDDDTPF